MTADKSILWSPAGLDGRKPDDSRAFSYAAFLLRRDGMSDGHASPRAVAGLLERLSSKGCLAVDPSPKGFRVSYIASAGTATAFAREVLSQWPSSVLKRIAKGARTTSGALFDFPFETGSGVVQVFITDWSPCPAACAVVLHRHHLAAGGTADGFTGRFVRHPLTGDILPLWVADWVKPTFGTGAVLVNPAHDRADLAYARRIGLPIRFGLEAKNTDLSPANWPSAPVIKSGRTTKTGPYDGLDIVEATQTFFEVLSGRGLARRHDDVRLDVALIAELKPDPDGELVYDDLTGRIGASGNGPRFGVAPSPALTLAASLALNRQERTCLVLTAAHQRDILPILAPLLHEEGTDVPPRIISLGPVENTAFVDQPEADLAIHVAARPDQPAVIRQQNLEQIRRFLDRHKALSGPRSEEFCAAEDAAVKPIRSAMRAGDTAAAFRALTALQKQLADRSPAEDLLAAYRQDTWTLLGLN